RTTTRAVVTACGGVSSRRIVSLLVASFLITLGIFAVCLVATALGSLMERFQPLHHPGVERTGRVGAAGITLTRSHAGQQRQRLIKLLNGVDLKIPRGNGIAHVTA